MDTGETWGDDVLAGFEARPIGKATLVRSTGGRAEPRGAVLHVHGYNDYFFQTHLATFFEHQGLAFFAVDMRRAGRSLRSGDVPHYMTDISQLGDDIDAAAAAINAAHRGLPLVIHAHSTGGLAAAVWAADRPAHTLAGLALDSPFFAVPTSLRQRLASRAVPAFARARPMAVVQQRPSAYARHLLTAQGGRWDFDTDWKTPLGVPVRAAWLAAVHRAQARVMGGLRVDVPVLVARSHSTGPDRDDNPLIDAQDTVVDVQAIARYGPGLSAEVTEAVITGGVHELSLSAPVPRAAYLAAIRSWLPKAIP